MLLAQRLPARVRTILLQTLHPRQTMKTKVIPTKLEVFNIGQNFNFDVNTPQFLKEACEYNDGGMYTVCWNIFRALIAQVAERATELKDPVLDTLMIRLNLYELPNTDRYKVVEQLKEMYDESVEQQDHVTDPTTQTID